MEMQWSTDLIGLYVEAVCSLDEALRVPREMPDTYRMRYENGAPTESFLVPGT